MVTFMLHIFYLPRQKNSLASVFNIITASGTLSTGPSLKRLKEQDIWEQHKKAHDSELSPVKWKLSRNTL